MISAGTANSHQARAQRARRSLAAICTLAGLDEVPAVAVKVLEDGDRAVGLGSRGLGESDSGGPQPIVICFEVFGVQEDNDTRPPVWSPTLSSWLLVVWREPAAATPRRRWEMRQRPTASPRRADCPRPRESRARPRRRRAPPRSHGRPPSPNQHGARIHDGRWIADQPLPGAPAGAVLPTNPVGAEEVISGKPDRRRRPVATPPANRGPARRRR